jgi:hypothetical protein
MTKAAYELVPDVVPASGVGLSDKEADAILEIAYLAILADHKLSDDELEAFRGVVARVRSIVGADPSSPYRKASEPTVAKLTNAELDGLLDDLRARTERVEADERLRVLAKGLSPAARELAYKVAYALGLADMDSSDEEFEFDLQLVDALELPTERAEELGDDVMAVLNGGGEG